MCGILAIASMDGHALQLTDARVRQMRDAMRNRGPDDVGLLRVNERAILAHRRLSIRDPEHGQQPWTSPSGRWTLTFNGELYNCAELQRLTGHAFPEPLQTTCDTELLARMLDVYGTDAAQRLAGMFAFAAYDRQEDRLVLVRDRFGVKPLYYTQMGNQFVCASSLAALRQHPDLAASVNRRAAVHYLMTLRPTLGRETLWDDVFLLEPAEQLVVKRGQLTRSRYWEYPQAQRSLELTQGVAQFAGLLSTAVERRLVSDVPVGMMLSGGVDSALLASQLQQQLGTDYVAQCGHGKLGDSSTEAIHAEQTAQLFGCRFRTVDVTAQQYHAGWEQLVADSGQPLTTPSDVIILRLAESLKQEVGVVLGGEGADELFGGYPPIHALGLTIDRDGRFQGSELNDLCQRYLTAATVIPATGIQLLTQLQWSQCIDDVEQYYCAQLQAAEPSDELGLTAISRLLHRVNLEALLLRLDQATMAAGLEARVPFTDHELVDAFWKIPFDLKIDRSRHRTESSQWEFKHLLRELARQRVPQNVAERPKQSFPTPAIAWMQADWSDWVTESIQNSDLLAEMCQPEPLQQLTGNPQAAGLWLWPLINLAVWERLG